MSLSPVIDYWALLSSLNLGPAYRPSSQPWSLETHGSHIANGVELVPGAPGYQPQLAYNQWFSLLFSAPPKTFTVTNNAGTLAFGGTATGDITFTVAADGTTTLVRDGVTAATKLDVATITNAGGTIKLAANATGLSVAKAAAMIAITGFDANGFTYSISDTAAALAANVGAPITGAINVTFTDAATIAQLTTIDGLTTGTLTYTAVRGLAADLAVNAGGYIKDAINVTVTDAATIAQLTTIDGLTTGTLTYTAVRGLAADLAVNAGGYIKDAINVTVTGAVATGADLNTIDAATTALVDATAVTTITGSGADFAALGAAKTAGTITLAANFAATVTDPVNVADANLFDAATTGVVTATISETAAATLATLTGTGNAYTITVTGAASAAHLNTINAATTVAVTATGVTSISGLAADFGTLLVAKTANKIALATDFAATVTDSDADETVLNAILGITTGTVTASLTGAATLNNVLTNGDANDALTITLDAGAAAALDLIGLDGKTSVNVGASAITSINGTAADVKTVVDAATITKSGSYAATISDGDANEVTLNAILGATTGVVTANLVGAAATLNNVLTNATAADALTITLDAGAAAALDLIGLDGKTSVNVGASAITSINGTAADVKTVVDAATITKSGSYAATISDGDANEVTLNAILGATTGVVTANLVGVAATLNSVLTNGDANDALTITLDAGAADASVLTALDGKTSVAVNATSITAITGSAADFAALQAAKTAGTIILADNFAATVTAPVNVANANLFDTATTGVVTATISDTDAATLAGLTGTNNAYTITVSGAATAAKLNTINAATTVAVTATGVTSISGLAADFGALLVAKAANEITLAANFAATVTDFDADETVLNHILGNTTGVVTASLTGAAATLNNVLTNAMATDALTITLDAGAAAALDLIGLDGKTSVAVNATSITAITGSAADFDALLAAKTAGTITLADNFAAILTDALTLTQLKAINIATNGAITLADSTVALTGSAADVASALKGLTDYSGPVTLTDAATVAQAVAVDAATTGTLTLSGGLKDAALAFVAADGTLAAGVAALLALGPAVQLTNAHNLAQLKAINDATTGAITLFDKSVSLTGAAVDVVAALQGISDYSGAVTLTDAPTIAQAQAVDALTTGTLTLSGGLKDAVLKFAGTDGTLTAGAATLLALQPAVQLTDAHNLAQLKAINNATTGVITLFNKSVALTGLYADVLAALNGISDYAGSVTLTNVVTVAQAKTMDNATTGLLTMSGGLKDSGLNLATADGTLALGVSELLARNPAVEFTDATTVAQWQAVDSITNGAVSGKIQDTVLAANGLNFSAPAWAGVKGVVLTGSMGDQIVTGSAFADILSGGSGADVLTGGGGADTFVYTEVGQGGVALAGNAATALSAGDTINYVLADNDKIDLSAVATGTDIFLGNDSGSWHLGSFGVCIISNVDFNYQQGVTTAAQVSTAIGTVFSSGGEVGYAAVLDNQGNGDPSDDTYALFEISLSGPHMFSPIGANDTISLLGVINSNALNKNSFIL